MKIKSILVKSIAVAAMSVTGLVVANNAGSNTAQAAIVQNDASVVTVNYVSNNSINVYNNYENPVATGQILASNTSWKVIKTAYDSKGHKWYDLGKNQWVRAKYVTIGYHAAATQTQTTAQASTQAPAQSQTQNTQASTQAPAQSQTQNTHTRLNKNLINFGRPLDSLLNSERLIVASVIHLCQFCVRNDQSRIYSGVVSTQADDFLSCLL